MSRMPFDPEEYLLGPEPENHQSDDHQPEDYHDHLDQILSQIQSETDNLKEAQEISNDYFQSRLPFIAQINKQNELDKTGHAALSPEAVRESASADRKPADSESVVRESATVEESDESDHEDEGNKSTSSASSSKSEKTETTNETPAGRSVKSGRSASMSKTVSDFSASAGQSNDAGFGIFDGNGFGQPDNPPQTSETSLSNHDSATRMPSNPSAGDARAAKRVRNEHVERVRDETAHVEHRQGVPQKSSSTNPSNADDIRKNAHKNLSSLSNALDDQFSVPKEPSFSLEDYDFRSFKQQHSRFDETFVSDEDVSFYRGGVRHEFFLELDNRTETNGAIVDKIINYINYARNNPDDEILMTVAYADGSVPTKNIGKYSPIPRKIGNFVGRYLNSSIVDPDTGQTFYIPTMLQRTPNLRVTVSELSESYQDPADFFSGACHVLDVLDSVHRFVDYVNLQSDYDWDCSFEESPEFSCLKNKIINAALYGHDGTAAADKFTQDMDMAKDNLVSRDAGSGAFLDRENRYLKGIWKAVDESLVKNYFPHIGTITYSHRLEFKTYKQNVIMGLEHDLDTVLQLFAESAKAKKTKDMAAPLIVYPSRERPLSALCASVISKLFYWPSVWSPRLPLMLQPVIAIDSDKRLESDLRLVLDQYQTSIFRYFTTGGLNKSDLKKGKKYDPDLMPAFAPDLGLLSISELSSPVRSKDDLRDDIPDEDESVSAPPRSYEELQALAGSIGDAGAFVKHLRVDEVPLSVYQALLSRWPEGTFSPELIQSRSFMKHDVYDPPSQADSDSIAGHVFYPNSVLPFARIMPLK